ncbi:MAG: DMT family transporter [Actinobacteria bacterium]|nr:DMT family transporter [Actinomycetota bacterium]MBO0784482.1 DMT family transporter [Actinomycetota bacterium]
MATAIAVAAALAAAFCFAVGSLIQQQQAVRTEEKVLQARLLLRLARQPRWLAGVGLSAFSFALQGLALAFGPLALVQPLAATDVLFALPLIARRNRRRLTRRDAAGALTITAGISVFLAVSPPTEGILTPGTLAWAPAVLGVGALTVTAALAAERLRGHARVVWLAAAAGGVYGLLDALAKSSVGLLTRHGIGVLAHWEPYALIGAGLLGGLFGQSAFGAGPLSLSLPVIDTLEPVAAVVIAATVFGERLASSPGQLVLQLGAGVVAVAGIAVLSHSSVVRTEEERTPALPGERPGEGAGGKPGEVAGGRHGEGAGQDPERRSLARPDETG